MGLMIMLCSLGSAKLLTGEHNNWGAAWLQHGLFCPVSFFPP